MSPSSSFWSTEPHPAAKLSSITELLCTFGVWADPLKAPAAAAAIGTPQLIGQNLGDHLVPSTAFPDEARSLERDPF